MQSLRETLSNNRTTTNNNASNTERLQQEELATAFFDMANSYTMFNLPTMALNSYIGNLRTYPYPIGIRALGLAPKLSPLGKMPSAPLVHAIAFSIRKWSYRAARRYAMTWALPHMVNADQRASMHAPTLPQIYAGIEEAHREIQAKEAREAARCNPPVALVESHEDATDKQHTARFEALVMKLHGEGMDKVMAMMEAGKILGKQKAAAEEEAEQAKIASAQKTRDTRPGMTPRQTREVCV